MKTPQHQCWRGQIEYYLTEELKAEMVALHIKECSGCYDVFHGKTTNHDLNPTKIHSPYFRVRVLNRDVRKHEITGNRGKPSVSN